jgi:hypothetical protein
VLAFTMLAVAEEVLTQPQVFLVQEDLVAVGMAI